MGASNGWQIGLIGTHWSKGWIIENNIISHSVCTGITLGKYGDEFDNTSADTAEGYVETIKRAHAFTIPWTKEKIGHHIVRNNTISHCEQAGIVGSMGAAFSTITGNVIHDIHVRRFFGGAEMAGIKFHGAIDSTIERNHIYRTCLAIWLDWMTQGTRVSSNLLRDNDRDFFIEVNHGPYLIDNNISLSPFAIDNWSNGGAFVHNYFAGQIRVTPHQDRKTPFLVPHSTEILGLSDTDKGDDRYLNNIFAGPADLSQYDDAKLPVLMEGNVFSAEAKPSKQESGRFPVLPLKLLEKPEGYFIEVPSRADWDRKLSRKSINADILGKTAIGNAAFDDHNGKPIRINTDYFGKARPSSNPTPGPFENPAAGLLHVFKQTEER